MSKTVTVNVAYAQPNLAGSEPSGFNARGYIVNLDYTFHLKADKTQGDTTENKKPARVLGE